MYPWTTADEINFLLKVSARRGWEFLRPLYEIYRNGMRRWDPGVDGNRVVAFMSEYLEAA